MIAMLFLLNGCESNESPDDSVTESSDGTLNYILVCPIMETEYWQACAEGAARADAELGTSTKVIGSKSTENYAAEIVGYMEQALEEQPDGIIVYAGIDALSPLIETATERGIPVLAVDSDAPSTSRVAYVGLNDYNIGCEAGETMIDLTGGSAKLGILISSTSAVREMRVVEAFMDAVQDYDVEVLTMEETDADPDIAEAKAREMLTEHPDITAIFNTAGYNVTGAARAKQSLGLSDLVLIGFDDLPENIQYVRDGVIDALFVQQPEQMGYTSVYLMTEYIEKGGLTQESYDTEAVLVTRENVDTYANVETAYYGAGKTVRVGYYSGDSRFQDGFSDDERKSGYAYEYYISIAALTGWKYEYVYGTRTECMELLYNGEIDIVAGVYKNSSNKDDLLFSKYDMELDGQPRSFAINPDREDLLEELDNAMEQIRISAPNYADNLRQKYYSETVGQQLLSEGERSYLDETGTLRIGYVRGNLPLSDQDEDGNPTGVVKDLIETLSDFLRVEIVAVCYDNITLMEEGLRQSEIDAAFPAYSDIWLNESKGFMQTDPFISERVMLVYQGSYRDTLLDDVGLSSTGVGQRYYLAEYYPDAQISFYDSREDLFDAIENGEVSCVVGCASIFQRFLAQHTEYSNMNVAYLDTTEDFGMTVRQGDNILISTLNKAIRQTDSAEFTSAIIAYSNVTAPLTLTNFVREHVAAVILALSVFFICVTMIFVTFWKKTAALNNKLEAALDDAKHANQAKTNFLSSMSHDIRTPMNAIVGMTALASKHLDDKDRVMDCLGKIDLSSRHLLTLINDVLDLSKIESGKIALNPVNFSLRDLITALINIVRPQVKAKDLTFDVHIHKIEQEYIFADEVRINQIYINILSNAIKYTPDGGRVIVDLTQEPVDADNVRLIYRVQDTGIGMSEEYMSVMYETFTRAHDSRVSKIQGTGLGLAIVKQMTDIMGGAIDCQSTEGQGTTFTVTLEFPVGTKTTSEHMLPEGTQVLLVDDDEIFLESAKETLEDMGAKVETANSGTDAVEIIKARCQSGERYPVAMIIDWKMPDMSGLETVRAIEEIVGGNLPYILASAYDWSDVEDKLKDNGVHAFVSKPLFRSYIYEKMCEVLNISDKPEESAQASENDLAGMHILVAEDNELNWEVISELLSIHGITTELAENGQECVDMLTAAPEGTFDLVLMDVQMPVMNGRDAAKAIRASQISYVREIPIIAMTADAFAEDITACLAAGMDGHVSKPVDMDKLLQEIRKRISQHGYHGDTDTRRETSE